MSVRWNYPAYASDAQGAEAAMATSRCVEPWPQGAVVWLGQGVRSGGDDDRPENASWLRATHSRVGSQAPNECGSTCRQSRRPESNRGPHLYERCALPAELRRRDVSSYSETARCSPGEPRSRGVRCINKRRCGLSVRPRIAAVGYHRHSEFSPYAQLCFANCASRIDHTRRTGGLS